MSDKIIQSILVTVDNVIFTIMDRKLHLLLIERGVQPYKGYRALPGGFVKEEEWLEQAARRRLREEAWVTQVYLEQLYTFGDLHRDPRGRVVTTAYMAICHEVHSNTTAGSDANKSQYVPFKDLPSLAFDHLEIVRYAYQRLRSKLEYTNAAQYFLPKYFSLKQLQDVYEIILGQRFDVRNFRKKILSLHLIRQTEKVEVGVTHRPAKLYEFIHKDLQISPLF